MSNPSRIDHQSHDSRIAGLSPARSLGAGAVLRRQLLRAAYVDTRDDVGRCARAIAQLRPQGAS